MVVFAQRSELGSPSTVAQSITIIKVMMIRYEICNAPSGAVTRFRAPDDADTGREIRAYCLCFNEIRSTQCRKIALMTFLSGLAGAVRVLVIVFTLNRRIGRSDHLGSMTPPKKADQNFDFRQLCRQQNRHQCGHPLVSPPPPPYHLTFPPSPFGGFSSFNS